MRSHRFVVMTLAAALTTAMTLPVAARAAAQNTNADAAAQPQTLAEQQEQERQNAITDRYLTSVDAEMTSNVDTKNAAVGQEVSARTLQPARLADGTELPKGTRLVGHVIQVRAGGQEQGIAILALTFDRAEVKGKSVPVRAVIRTVAPSGAQTAAARDTMVEQGPMMAPPMSSGGTTAGRGSTRGGGVAGGMPGTTVPSVNPGRPVGSTIPTADPNGASGGGMGGGMGGSRSPSVADAGGSPTLGGRAADMTPLNGAATAANGNRRVADAGETTATAPRATGFPGVMLSASPNTSGTLTAFGHNISLDNGTKMTLGVITR